MSERKSIAFVNSKGGCGKTTSLHSIAGELTKQINKKKERILVIDADKQRNLTFCFLGSDGEETYGEWPENTLFDFLMGENENCVAKTKWKSRENANPKYYGVDIMIADRRLADEKLLSAVDIEDVKKRFEKLVKKGKYSYVLVDMPPSNKALNTIVFGALVDALIIPFSSDIFSVNGYGDIIEEMDECREINPNVKTLGIFFTRFSKGKNMDRWVESEVQENNMDLLENYIPFSENMRDTVVFHRPIGYYKPLSQCGHLTSKLTKEIIDRIEKA